MASLKLLAYPYRCRGCDGNDNRIALRDGVKEDRRLTCKIDLTKKWEQRKLEETKELKKYMLQKMFPTDILI